VAEEAATDPPATLSEAPQEQALAELALYDAGMEFAQFLDEAERRRDTWHANYEAGAPPAQLVQQARRLGDGWRLLVVAEDWCGDSANTIPYLARLVDEVPGFSMRVVRSEAGQSVMDRHPTPDGRGATPTVLILDAQGRERGAWVERPSALQSWFLNGAERLEEEDLYARKYAWYDWDKGESTVREIVELISSAAP